MVSLSHLLLITLLTWRRSAVATRVKGSLSSKNQDILHYLTRFGVGRGYDIFVYGQVKNMSYVFSDSHMVLALLPQQTWDGLYKTSKSVYSCDDIFEGPLAKSRLADSSTKCPNGTKNEGGDYLRIVPCQHSDGNFQSCNQPPNTEIIEGSDFTYHVSTAPKTEYYYLVFLTCTRNFTVNCSWARTEELTVQYNIHLVNNRPNKANSYTNEFPYELKGVLSLQLFFAISYIFLIFVHFLLHSKCCRKQNYRMHNLVKLFSVSLVLEAAYVLMELVYTSVYAGNGMGTISIQYLGEVCNQLSDWLLILVVILVGKGWQVTMSSLRWSKVTVLIWGAYILLSTIYFIWRVVSEHVYPLTVDLYYGYQSYAGGLCLIHRVFILVYLLYEMRQVYLIENRSTALTLYFILAICYIIWFSYLPILTLLALGVNPVRRLFVMSSVYLIFDFLINTGMVILFCPRWANRYFQFDHYINVLSHSSNNYRSLKSYGASETSGPI